MHSHYRHTRFVLPIRLQPVKAYFKRMNGGMANNVAVNVSSRTLSFSHPNIDYHERVRCASRDPRSSPLDVTFRVKCRGPKVAILVPRRC